MFSLMIAGIAILAAPTLAFAQQQTVDPQITAETFLEPPSEIADAILAPRHLNVRLGNPGPAGIRFLNVLDDGPPTMAMFAKPFYRLGGLQIDWGANRSRQFTTRAGIGIRITDGQTGATVDVDIPDGTHVSSPAWSPDGERIAFFVHTADETHVHVANPANGQSRQVTLTPVLATLATSFEWMPDSRSIVTVLVPANRGSPPVEPAVPTGPQVRLTTPETNRVRTYPDLLEGPHEKALLEYYGTGQLAVVDVENRRSRLIGQPAMVQTVSGSPDGSHLLVAAMQRPFSYIVPTRQFATKEEILSVADGSVLAVLSENDVNDGSPSDTATASNDRRRNAEWRADGSLGFLQMAERQRDNDNGDGNGEGRNGRRGRKDRVMQWTAPFDSASMTTLYEHDGRLSNARYSEDGQILFLSQQQGDNGHDFAVFLDDADTTYTLWRGRRARFTRRSTPTLVSKTLPTGVSVVSTTTSGEAFLSGTHNHDNPMVDGPQSYIDRIDIRTGDTTLQGQIDAVKTEAMGSFRVANRARTGGGGGIGGGANDVSRSTGLNILMPSTSDLLADQGPGSFTAYESLYSGGEWALFLADWLAAQTGLLYTDQGNARFEGYLVWDSAAVVSSSAAAFFASLRCLAFSALAAFCLAVSFFFATVAPFAASRPPSAWNVESRGRAACGAVGAEVILRRRVELLMPEQSADRREVDVLRGRIRRKANRQRPVS